MHWNGAFEFPYRVEELPNMGDNFHNVTDAPGELGSYWFLQVDGPASSVLGWLAQFGIEQIDIPLATLSQAGQVDTDLTALRIVIDDLHDQAHAYQETALLLSVNLD